MSSTTPTAGSYSKRSPFEKYVPCTEISADIKLDQHMVRMVLLFASSAIGVLRCFYLSLQPMCGVHYEHDTTVAATSRLGDCDVAVSAP